MKKTTTKFLLVLAIISFSVQPVMAAEPKTSNCSGSFTLLPCTDKSMDECNSLIDKYLATGTVPSAKQNLDDAQSVYDDFSQDLNNMKQNVEQFVDQGEQLKKDMANCANTYGADNPVCKSQQNAYKANQEAIKNEIAKVDEFDKKTTAAKKELDSAKQDAAALGTSGNERDDLLACAVKTGRMDLALVPYYITYMINFALGLIGLISVLFIVIGGYRYVIGGLGEDKEKGKKTISHALMGMGVALLAWSLVNIILKAITG